MHLKHLKPILKLIYQVDLHLVGLIVSVKSLLCLAIGLTCS